MTPQEILFWTSTAVLFTTSIASVLSGIAWMRYEEERELLDAKWPTDGLTREPRRRSK